MRQKNDDQMNHSFSNMNPEKHPNRSRSEELLLQVVKDEIESRLETSLHHASLNQFKFQKQSEKVNRLWNLELRTDSALELLPPKISALEIFEHVEVAGRLLIVGKAGSGKTTMMLELARELVEQAEIDSACPIPIIFDFSSRKSAKQPISDWLADDLKLRYGVRYGTKVNSEENYLARFRLLPLLDGLDEVETSTLANHVWAVNEWLQAINCPSRLVICSKWEEFEKPGTWHPGALVRLSIKGTLLLKPLTDEQIQIYLAALEASSLWQLLQQDKNLLKTARIPFWLNVICISRAGLSLEGLQQLTSESQLSQYLLDAYIGEMLQRGLLGGAVRKYKAPTNEQTKRWLAQ